MPTHEEIREFSTMICTLAAKNNQSVWDTLVDYCCENQIEHTSVAALIDKPLKEIITAEVRDLNLLRGEYGKGAKLPI